MRSEVRSLSNFLVYLKWNINVGNPSTLRFFLDPLSTTEIGPTQGHYLGV